MGASAEEAEHAGGVFRIFWLAENLVVEGDRGVRAEDGEVGFGEFAVDGFGFLTGQAGDVGDWVFARRGIFRDVGGMDAKGEAGLSQEFFAAWGG